MEDGIIRKARMMADEGDENMKVWIDIWDNGVRIKDKRRKKRGVEVFEASILPHNDYVYRQIEKAVRLREEGKVMRREVIE